jgi:ribosome-associated protein
VADDDLLKVTRSLAIPLSELEWRFDSSGGPGGQHANRSATRAELRFDVEGSPSLGPRQRSKLLEVFGPSIRVVAGEHRSQARNREAALRRLSERIAGALAVTPPRVRTAPTARARAQRVEDKRRRGDLKRKRAKAQFDDG